MRGELCLGFGLISNKVNKLWMFGVTSERNLSFMSSRQRCCAGCVVTTVSSWREKRPFDDSQGMSTCGNTAPGVRVMCCITQAHFPALVIDSITIEVLAVSRRHITTRVDADESQSARNSINKSKYLPLSSISATRVKQWQINVSCRGNNCLV